MNKLKSNIFFKIATILVITLLLMIPASMIRGIINERESTQNEAISEVSSKWAEQQIISGPFISIPYIKMVREKADTVSRLVPVKEYIHVMPEELDISGDITPETRNRGIYEIVVYNSKINLKGKFNKVNLSGLDVPLNSIMFDKAEFVIGINDLRGIEKPANMDWNGNQVVFNPGVSSKDVVSSGINATVVFSDTMNYNFSVSLDLKGSQLLYFTPVGKVTDVKISSDWPDPSFDGAFLPDSRTVSAKGFEANWNVLHLNRNYPQIWTGTQSTFRLIITRNLTGPSNMPSCS
jgi:inner membrane protein